MPFASGRWFVASIRQPPPFLARFSNMPSSPSFVLDNHRNVPVSLAGGSVRDLTKDELTQWPPFKVRHICAHDTGLTPPSGSLLTESPLPSELDRDPVQVPRPPVPTRPPLPRRPLSAARHYHRLVQPLWPENRLPQAERQCLQRRRDASARRYLPARSRRGHARGLNPRRPTP